MPLLKEFELIKNAILAKGKSHYYCHYEYENNSPKLKKYKESFINFFETSESGHRSDYEKSYGPISNKDWDLVSLTATKGQCNECEHCFECPTHKHRSKFNDWRNELVITNHDQLIQSFMNVNSDDYVQSPIVPIDPGIIIIDEAHDFQENYLGRIESPFSHRELFGLIQDINHDLRPKYRTALEKLAAVLKVEGEKEEYPQGRFPISESLQACLKSILNLLNEALIKSTSNNERRNPDRTDYISEKDERVEKFYTSISNTLNSNFVSWVTYEDRSFSSISRLFHTQFKNFLYKLAEKNKIIIMSGTLSLDGDFSNLMKQWRLESKLMATLALPSSFSYKQQALVYVPTDLPDVKDNNDQYIDARIEQMKTVLNVTGGRSLILSTCKKLMDLFYVALNPFLLPMKIKLLKQESSGVETLTKQFKEDITSVLIGSGSFFSGLSVPGESLVSVILTRLPFPVPNDPYLKLIGEGYEDIFFNVITFPTMMIKLNQAMGRLIRDIKDYGIITILDPRIFTMDYGKQIIKSFDAKGYKITRNLQEVEKFILLGKSHSGVIVDYPKYDRKELKIPDSLLYDPDNDLINSLAHYRMNRTSQPVSHDNDHHESQYVITEKQWDFYNKIRKLVGLSEMRLFRLLIGTPRDLYQYLVDVLAKKGMDSTLVEKEFPFENELQKINYNRYKSKKANPMIVYKLSPEEIKRRYPSTK